ncbi:MAG: hypothetical protein CMO82_03105 [Winogradskyella sp.]|nr:hypothetical protein [Winogradskyella sp.]|tara:strand:- start:381 stop:668 length:288 start_codon:yes stop_codon:yes gene_type:complete
MILKRTIALLFVMLFTLMICAPTIIISCDDSADISAFFGMNEEEEDTKVLFDKSPEELEDISIDINKKEYIVYTAKEYYIPHLNLISPPPERYLI